MRTETRAAFSVLVLLALLAIPLASSVEAEIIQPSPTNNILFLHYNSNSKIGWMNTDKKETEADSLVTSSGGFMSNRSFSFPLAPRLNGSNFIVLDGSQEWSARIHMEITSTYGMPPRDVTASVTVGNLTFSSNTTEYVDACYLFRINGSAGFIDPDWEFTLTFSFMGHGCMDHTAVTIYTDGSSHLTVPIAALDVDTDSDGLPDSLDPDDDADGHNDTKDAYPLDIARWAKPQTSSPRPLWLYASPPLVILALVAAAFLWRRNRHKDQPLR